MYIIEAPYRPQTVFNFLTNSRDTWRTLSGTDEGEDDGQGHQPVEQAKHADEEEDLEEGEEDVGGGGGEEDEGQEGGEATVEDRRPGPS